MSGAFPIVALLTADDPAILPLFGQPLWGVFDQNGNPVLVSDAVGSLDYDREYENSKYPQEQGAFQTYNKVQVPYEAQITLLSNRTRKQLLSILEPVVASLQLVTIVMPEWGYPNANLKRYTFRRTVRSGVTMLAVDIWAEEVRFGRSMLTSSATPQPQTQSNGGTSRPVGQVNGNASLAPGGSANQDFSGTATGAGNQAGAYIPIKNLPSQEGQTVAIPPANQAGQVVAIPPENQAGQYVAIPPSATNTASTNAAFPTQSGPVQATTPNEAGVTIPIPAKPALGFSSGFYGSSPN